MRHSLASIIDQEHKEMGRLKRFPAFGNSEAPPTSPNLNSPSSQIAGSTDKTHEVHKQVDELRTIMESNLDKTIQRGADLDTLEAQSRNLQDSSAQFSKNAGQVEQNLKWKKMRTAIIVSLVLLVVIAVVVGVGVIMAKKKKKNK